MRTVCFCGDTTECNHGEIDREIVFGFKEQTEISDWAVQTFGPVGSNASCAARANTEMAELVARLCHDDNDPDARSEIADIVIVLARLSDRLGGDIAADVATKMEINRNREWDLTGGGHGQHKQGTKLVEGTWDWALRKLDEGKMLQGAGMSRKVMIYLDSPNQSWRQDNPLPISIPRYFWQKYDFHYGGMIVGRWTPDYDAFTATDWRIVE